MKLPPLKHVLGYHHPHDLKLYQQNYPNHQLSAEAAFQEVLKYLWLTRKHKQDRAKDPDAAYLPRNCIMLRSMQEIDDMWHEFILFTEDYTAFCHDYFGEYIHHVPNVFATRPQVVMNMDMEVAKLLPIFMSI